MRKNQKIPKIIHYCWFGGKPLPEKTKEYMKTWQEQCPDYEIMRWNESNFDINKYNYAREAYEKRKWAFVSDVCRLEKMYEFGGIYFDVNTEVLQNFDKFLDNDMFVGFEQDNLIAGCVFGAKKRHPFIGKMLNEYYKKERLLNDAGEINFRTINNRMQVELEKMGLVSDSTFQQLEYITVYPKEYFCPRYWNSPKQDLLTKNTHTIHYFGASWHDKESREMFNRQNESSLVSIIVPFYNEERHLRECLESIISQTYHNYEVIMVDDASTDSSDKIADSYVKKDARFKVIHKPKNQGLNMARASGFRECSGEYVTFLDGDDMFRPDNLEKSLIAVHRYDVNFARYQYEFVPHKESHGDDDFSQLEPLKITNKKDMFLAQVTWYPGFRRHFPMTVWGGLYNRKLVEKVDWRKSNYRVNEDNFWMLQVLDVARTLVVIPDQLYQYRVNDKRQALSKSISGNNFNGRPVGFLELIEKNVAAMTEYAKKYKLDITQEIDNYRKALYIERTEKLCDSHGFDIENNAKYIPQAIEILCEEVKNLGHDRDNKQARIELLEAEVARLESLESEVVKLRPLEAEVARLNTIRGAARRLAGNIKRRVLGKKRR